MKKLPSLGKKTKQNKTKDFQTLRFSLVLSEGHFFCSVFPLLDTSETPSKQAIMPDSVFFHCEGNETMLPQSVLSCIKNQPNKRGLMRPISLRVKLSQPWAGAK